MNPIYNMFDGSFGDTPTYPPGNEETYPTKREVRKIIDSDMQAGWGYVIVPRRVSVYNYGIYPINTHY